MLASCVTALARRTVRDIPPKLCFATVTARPWLAESPRERNSGHLEGIGAVPVFLEALANKTEPVARLRPGEKGRNHLGLSSGVLQWL